MYFIVPAGIALYKILPPDLVPRAQHLLSTIARRKMAGRTDAYYDDVRLMAKGLNRVLGWRNRKRIIKALVDAGIIVQHRHYKVGKTPMGFDYSAAAGQHRFDSLRAPTRAAELVVNASGGLKQWQSPMTPTHAHLAKWVRAARIPDIAAAHAVIDAQGYQPKDIGIMRFVADALHTGQHTLANSCRPDSYGRFHTPISRLKRELRPLLRIGDHALVLIDVRNCQPLLVALAMRLCQADPTLFDAARFGESFTLSTYLTPLVVDAGAMHTHSPSTASPMRMHTEGEAEGRGELIMMPQNEGFSAQTDSLSELTTEKSAHNHDCSGFVTSGALPNADIARVPRGYLMTAAENPAQQRIYPEKPVLKTGMSDGGFEDGFSDTVTERPISDQLATTERQSRGNVVTSTRGGTREDAATRRAGLADVAGIGMLAASRESHCRIGGRWRPRPVSDHLDRPRHRKNRRSRRVARGKPASRRDNHPRKSRREVR